MMKKIKLFYQSVLPWVGFILIIACVVFSKLDYFIQGIACGIIGIALIIPRYWQLYLKQKEKKEESDDYSFIKIIILAVVLVFFIVIFIINMLSRQ